MEHPRLPRPDRWWGAVDAAAIDRIPTVIDGWDAVADVRAREAAHRFRWHPHRSTHATMNATVEHWQRGWRGE